MNKSTVSGVFFWAAILVNCVLSIAAIVICSTRPNVADHVDAKRIAVNSPEGTAISLNSKSALLNDRELVYVPAIELSDSKTGKTTAILQHDYQFGSSIELYSKSLRNSIRIGFDYENNPCIVISSGTVSAKYVFKQSGDSLVLVKEQD